MGGILDSIWNTLSKGGSNLTGLENLGILGSDIFGTVGNIGLSQAEADLANEGLGLAKAYGNLTPGQVSAGINQYLQPLNANLVRGIDQNVAQSLAAQGLAGSPGLMTAETAAALAPYEQQNQQLATQDFFNQFQLPLNAIGAVRFPNPSPISPLINPANSISTGSGIAGLVNSFLGGGSGSSVLPALPSVGTNAGELAALGAAGTDLSGLGTAGALDALPLSTLDTAGISSLAPEAVATTGAGTAAGVTGALAGLGSDISGAAGAVGGGITSGLSALIPLLSNPITWGIGGAALLAKLLLHGADPNQVKTATGEQGFEVATDNVNSLVKRGKLTVQQGQQLINEIKAQGDKSLQGTISGLNDQNPKIAGALTNFNDVVNNELAGLSQWSGVSQNPITGVAANDPLFINPSAQGWEPGAVSSGDELSAQLINQLLAGGNA